MYGGGNGGSADREGKRISAICIYSDKDELLFSPNWKESDVIGLLPFVWLAYLRNGAILETYRISTTGSLEHSAVAEELIFFGRELMWLDSRITGVHSWYPFFHEHIVQLLG